MTGHVCAFCGESVFGPSVRGMHRRCHAKALDCGAIARLRPARPRAAVKRDPDPATDPLVKLVDDIVRRRST